MLIYLIIIWKMDKYEREPLINVIVHFLWGAFGAIFFAVAGSSFFNFLFATKNNTPPLIVQSVIFAPFTEEIAKGSFLLKTVTDKKFDNLIDGLVYGGAIGLGFGMTENFIYYLSYGTTFYAWLQLVIIRSGFSAVMHCISTAALGAFLAIAKFSENSIKFLLPIFGFLIAMVIHSIWNLSVSFVNTYIWGTIFIFLLIIFFISLFKFFIVKERKIILRELTEEANMNLIPFSHLSILSSKSRLKKGWIDERIRKLYVRTAIKLAFRKAQFKISNGYKKLYYENEIKQCRNLISDLLSTNIK
ncbi:PrsW family intramembrane metalloprotease [Melioribacteraceae bacterium 4301-Me]|uniref:PrsW family intramembrane metalloprotease n=1 Tax=Pyranulibacter aquaticus TaxID=3163344 RepID=UPI00359AEFA3